MIPVVSAEGYEAARRGAAFVDRSDRGRILVSGPDRASYLHGLLTNDIAALTAGHGCYTAYLTAQGRMIADLWAYELGDAILLMMEGSVKQTVLSRLDQFIFMEDVRLEDVSATFAEIGVVGPDAARRVAAALTGTPDLPSGLPNGLLDVLDRLVVHGNVRLDWKGGAVIVTRTTDVGEPGYDVYVERTNRESLTSSLAAVRVARLDEQTADAIRIEAGVPVFHRDMDEQTIPLEAGIESRAISFTKGCYVGQEVIIRVLHRGHGRVVRKLAGLRMEGTAVPGSGTPVQARGREIGRITSAVMSPALQRPIAMALLHRDFLEPGTTVSVDGAPAEVVSLPFV